MSQVSLRVAEAQSRDVGRGIARIDPKVSSEIGLSAGDVVKFMERKRLWQYIGPDTRKILVKASFA